MTQFTISQVEAFSQVKAGTIRVWEKRYGICKPSRNNGKNRRYNLAELELLLNVALLNKNGYKVSSLAECDAENIRQKVSKLSHADDQHQNAINLLILYKYAADVEAFEIIIDHCFRFFGIDTTLKNIVLPFLKKVNLLSYNNSSNEVLLAVASIRKKLMVCIENTQPVKKLNKSALLFLPQNEHFDLMLLYMSYLVKVSGYETIYLGSNISEQNIMALLKLKKPNLVCTYLKPQSRLNLPNLIPYMHDSFPRQHLNVVSSEEDLTFTIFDEAIKVIHYNDFPRILQSA